jgi:cardiolipin synthase
VEFLKYYKEGDDLYTEMLNTIECAKVSVDIESYIFEIEGIGNDFIKLLKDKANQNVVVRILLDSVGSNRFKNHAFFNNLTKSAVQIKWFNPWSWRSPLRFNKRNHRKLMIIDNDSCFLGGFNIHNESSQKYFGVNRWKDSHISFKGSLSMQLSQQFDLMWNRHEKKLEEIKSFDSLTKILPNYTRSCRRLLRCRYLDSISNSKSTIRVTTPYFVPDSKMLNALISAANSNIKIILLVPKYTDHALLKYAAYWYYKKLLCTGISIYEYKARMLHSKNMLIDNQLAVIGSANLDYRSFFLNNEIMLFSKRQELIFHIQNDFDECIKASNEVTLKDNSKRSHFSLFGTFIAYQLRKWL